MSPTPSEQVKLLGGTPEEQKMLYSSFSDRLLSGEVLEEHEIIMMKALENIFTADTVPGSMMATVSGTGGVDL